VRVALLLLIACGSSSERPVATPPSPPVPDAAVAVTVDAATPIDALPVAPARAATLELAFVGDLMFGGYFDDHYDPQYVEKHDPLVDVAPLLSGDLVFGNFETTITRKLPNNGGPHDGSGNKRFVTIPERAAVIAKRFHAVTLANNHALDNATAGLVETPKILGELGIKYVGAAREAPRFRVETLEVKGWKLGFVAATAVTNRSPGKTGPQPPFADETKLKAELLPVIAAARKDHDLVIVQLHWGYEYQDAPARWQIDAAHAFVDAGADAVIGHHPHVLQGIERYKGGVIAYSLGNFVFPNAKERVRDTGVLHLTFASCLSAIAFDPAFQIRQPITHPIRPTASQRAEVGKRLAELSKPMKTTWDVSGERFTAPAACP
jgi:poly-gamma-glutamate capsule biosynthesis protein CapA/YwtB (metallophosphatase superfamily)